MADAHAIYICIPMVDTHNPASNFFFTDVSGIRDKMHTGSDHDLQLQGTTIDPTILQAT